MSKLLPPDFDQFVASAVQQFWTTRGALPVSTSQEGSRSNVIAGKNLDGFALLFRKVALYCGIEQDHIYVTGKKFLTLPGYFRPTKMWDALVVYKGRLIAALELKSQVGSFGNNYNNRSEESIGLATDFWTAFRERAFQKADGSSSDSLGTSESSKPPFLGYMMLLEDCPNSSNTVRIDESHYRVFPEFTGASYAKRYEILMERLVSEKLYSSGSLVLSNALDGARDGSFSFPKQSLSPRSLYADFAAHLLAIKEVY